MSTRSAAVRAAAGASAPAPTPAPTTQQIASIELGVLRRHKSSIRFDAAKNANEPILGNLYLDKVALVNNFTAPKAGMIPGKVKVTVEVTDWVDGATVPTADEFAARKAAASSK